MAIKERVESFSVHTSRICPRERERERDWIDREVEEVHGKEASTAKVSVRLIVGS
jgi:hypothetical protein